jgi:hypothetical protein
VGLNNITGRSRIFTVKRRFKKGQPEVRNLEKGRGIKN